MSSFEALTLSSHGPSQTKLKVIPFIEAIIVIMNSDTEQDDTRGMHEMKYNQVGKLLSGIKAAGIDIMELDLQIQLFFKSLKVLISTQDALIATHWKTVRWDPQRHTRSGHTEVSIQIAAKQVNSLFERYEE